jgi:hypothetical protein
LQKAVTGQLGLGIGSDIGPILRGKGDKETRTNTRVKEAGLSYMEELKVTDC